MSKICFGCGAKLQGVDDSKEGYVPLEKLESSDYCKRCFRMMNYGEKGSSDTPKSLSSIVNSVNKNAKFVVFLVDFVNIFDDVMNIFKSIKVPKILAISKSDIIPKNVSFGAVRNYLKVVYKVRDEIVFTSNKTNMNTLMKKLYGKEEVYFLGLTNAGKSTLLNTIIDCAEKKTKKLTTSYKENTTRDFVRIKLGEMTLIDSPGFVIENYELDKFTNISGEIKPITYQNKGLCTYKLDGLFDVMIEGNTNPVFYFSKSVGIKRAYKATKGVSFKVGSQSDVVICGLGFIKLTDECTITVPNEVMRYVNVRPSIVGGKYE